MQSTSDSHATKFYTVVPEAEILVANNTFLAASVSLSSSKYVPLKKLSASALLQLLPACNSWYCYITFRAKAETFAGNESFVSHLTIKETFYLESTPELQTCYVSVE